MPIRGRPMRCYGLSETLVCIVQYSLFYEGFVHNSRHVSKPIKRDVSISLTALKAQQSDGLPFNPF